MQKTRTSKAPSSTSAGEKLRRDFSIMTPQELAAMLEISLSSINQWRSNGEGPAYTKLGRRVYYRKQDVMTWIDEGLMVRADAASASVNYHIENFHKRGNPFDHGKEAV